jgi:hypothetical protein
MRLTTEVCLLVALVTPVFAQPTQWLYTATGDNAAGIQSEVDRFRRDLGDLNPNQPNSFPAGRREINWDGVGGTQGNDNLPQDFFHRTSPRGLILSTPGTRLKVSGDRDTPSFAMRDLTQSDWADEVIAFSGDKFFAPIRSTVTDVEFRMPGTNEIACVTAFGAVFMDVDRTGSSMEVTMADGSKRTFAAPVQSVSSRGFSFVGARFASGCIVNVRLVNGDTPVDTRDSSHPNPDRVGIDDFIYAEPVSVTRGRY